MARLSALFLLLVVVCVYGAPKSPQPCDIYEEWNDCAVAKSCEARCGYDTPIICPTICVARCQCIKGFKRNFNSNIVSLRIVNCTRKQHNEIS
ncbi:chymotrypsin inhibitor Ani s 6-like [Nylanderia fulva]|uniref:chymotrypsin inhibitor Ani s 6-like n=1 Tax=Nylanderia fulva TaxID=613905 RepID=UPI0010FAE8AB|nr:chymotrypsin inhibitor Ani s 6-like [Nylanderia fulva]